MYFPQSWRLVSPRSRHRQIWCLVRTHFLVHRQQLLTVSSHGRKGREPSVVSFIRTVIPIIRAPPSLPNCLPKALPPNAITLGIRFQYIQFGRHKHSAYSTISWLFHSLFPLPGIPCPQIFHSLFPHSIQVSTQCLLLRTIPEHSLKTSTPITLNPLTPLISLPSTYHYVIVSYWFVWLFMVCHPNQNVSSINIRTLAVFFSPL